MCYISPIRGAGYSGTGLLDEGDLDSARIYADKVIRSNKFRFASKTSLNTFMQKTVSMEETIGAVHVEVYSDWLTQHVRRQDWVI
ncbi:MAG: hypothetical protein ACLUPL_09835 [Butyricimonas virosa]